MRYKLIFILVIISASFLRIYELNNIPNGLYADELSSGYDAYSVLETGKDRYGIFLPILFRSFGDYIPGAYNFSIIPFIYLFDLNAFSIRLPAAIFGILSVILIFFITKRIFNEKIALIAGFFSAISPWHLQYSRIAFPAISFLFMFLLSFLLLLKSIKNIKYLILSSITLGLTFYTYAVSKLFVPLFLLIFLIIYRKNFNFNVVKKNYKVIIIAIIIFVLISFLPFYLTFYGKGNERFSELSIFNKEKTDTPLKEFIKNYFSYYSPDFLFFGGDKNLRHGIRNIGQLYWFDIILVLTGLILALLNLKKKKNKLLIFWLLIFPIAAALTNEGNPHATRSLIGLPVFIILSSYGFYYIFNFLKKNNKRILKIIFVIFILLSVFNIGYYFKNYYIDYPRYSKDLFQAKLDDAFDYLEENKDNYNRVIISDSIKPETYIYILFYTKFNPGEYQKYGFSKSKYKVDNVWLNKYNEENIYLAMPYEFKNLTGKIIYYSDGEPAFKIV